ncbi:hypothetical protein H5410_028248 [Solanum commersonii]|uniref:Uncharacterized protein n=1 Tax=Solanum commersonii TaxID=4109 RepID=A0A9J5Z5L9_SOLCO|nr:hypothetical protein H5410_028248 [Solanum commersonii]
MAAKGFIVRLSTRLDSAPPSSILSGSLGYPITVGSTLQVQGPSVGIQTPGSSSVPSMVPPRFAALVIFASAMMSITEQKSFERFVRFAPLKFDSTPREKAYDSLTKCHNMLFNLGILEAHREQFTGIFLERLCPIAFEIISRMRVRVFYMLDKVVAPRGFLARVSSVVIYLEVEIIQAKAHMLIRSTNGVSGSRPSQTSQVTHSGSSSQGGRADTYGYSLWGLGVWAQGKGFPKRASSTIQSGSHATLSKPTPSAGSTSYGARGGTKGGDYGDRSIACGGSQTSVPTRVVKGTTTSGDVHNA